MVAGKHNGVKPEFKITPCYWSIIRKRQICLLVLHTTLVVVCSLYHRFCAILFPYEEVLSSVLASIDSRYNCLLSSVLYFVLFKVTFTIICLIFSYNGYSVLLRYILLVFFVGKCRAKIKSLHFMHCIYWVYILE